MPVRTVLADQQKMFVEGIQAIINDMKHPMIKIVGMAYSREELDNFLEMPVDLLITEINMGETEGLSYLKSLRNNLPYTRIIVLSSYGDSAIVREAFISGVDGYVLKSNHSLEIFQCIDAVLEGKTYMADGLRLAPDFDRKKKAVQTEKRKMMEDRFLLKQKLTKREKQILSMIVQWKNNKTIAQELYISDQTVSAHRKRIMKKFGVSNTMNLIKFTLDNELV